MIPALPSFEVVTLHVADPASVPVFVTVNVTASPPGTETADESDAENGPTPFDEAPASAARCSCSWSATPS